MCPNEISRRRNIMFGYGYGMSSWGYACMGIGMVVFWGLLIVGVVALIRFIGRDQDGQQSGPATPTAQHLLAERFARGEISDTEYNDSLAVLRDHART
jgi:putative membrane protein